MAGRDADRQRVYDAEDAAFVDTSYADPLGERGCRWLLERLATTPWWKAAGGAPPALRAARIDATRSAAVRGDERTEVRIAPGMDQAHVLTHELAHLVASPEAGHDSRFRAAHVDVATVVLGHHGAARLDVSYQRAGLQRIARAWPAPPDHGHGGLLAVWQARQALDALRR